MKGLPLDALLLKEKQLVSQKSKILCSISVICLDA
jgi:hypothetical protein